MSAPEKQFTTTHWSQIVLAGQAAGEQARAALERLCQIYWYPLYAYVRRRGYGPEDAEDLTQEFLARLLRDNFFAKADRSKGKFRSFMLASLNHVLANACERSRTLKRGGGQVLLSLDIEEGERRYREEPTTDESPEKLYERQWALTLLDQALRRLREEYVSRGREDQFERLKCFLGCEGEERSYAELAARDQTTPNAIAAAVYRLRQRYRELVREQISPTVSGPEELEQELQYLFAALG